MDLAIFKIVMAKVEAFCRPGRRGRFGRTKEGQIMRSKLLGIGIPFTAAVVAGVGWVRTHPDMVWSRLATQIVRRQDHRIEGEYHRLRQAAQRRLTSSIHVRVPRFQASPASRTVSPVGSIRAYVQN